MKFNTGEIVEIKSIKFGNNHYNEQNRLLQKDIPIFGIVESYQLKNCYRVNVSGYFNIFLSVELARIK